MIRFEKILCPVDFFPASLRAFEYALKLAENYGARIHALHVVAPIIPAAYGAAISIADITNEMEDQSRRQLEKLKASGRKKGVAVESDVHIGDIDVEIRHAITAKKADLVVMGTHGRRGFERWVMGSVTERLMRNCPVPLLAIAAAKRPTPAPPTIKRIVVTTDFSDGTADALNYAFSIAQECQSKIVLVHVLDDAALAQVNAKRRVALFSEIRKKMDDLVPEDARVWCDVETIVESGTPYRVIQQILKAQKPGLLVMNVHGKNLVDRALIGSTAERVIRGADCPVLLIPPKRAVKKTKAA